MIVFILTITGNLSALGLVLAAKAFARFKDLDKEGFRRVRLDRDLDVHIGGAAGRPAAENADLI